MSALLFNLTIDWVMRQTTSDRPRGIRWTLFSNLEDLVFADDLTLVSHTHQHMQEKTSRLSMFAQQVGLTISYKKTEVMQNVLNPLPVKVNGEDLPSNEEFTYLGSTFRHDGGADSDIRNRLNKARNAFRKLNKVWKSSQYSTKTKLGLHQSCVLSTLLYGLECWRMTESALIKLFTSTPRTFEEAGEYSGRRPSPTTIFSVATKTASTLSSCKGDEDGSDM